MDANGLRFWMLADAGDWLPLGEPAAVYYDAGRRGLRLASRSERTLDLPTPGLSVALSALEQAPAARDAFGTRAWWDAGRGQVVATGALPGPVPIFTPPAGERPTDLALGCDGVLYVALSSGAVVMQDRRDRWDPAMLRDVPGFGAWRLAPDPAGGAWLLDRARRRAARLHGYPLPRQADRPYGPGVFRPTEENPAPPHLAVFDAAICPADELPVAIACSPGGRVAVLTWADPGGQSLLRMLEPEAAAFSEPFILRGAPQAFSLAWVAEDKVAALLPAVLAEAPVYRVPDTGAGGDLLPVGDLYPLRDHDGGPFLHGLDLPPHYPDMTPPAGSSLPLHRVSLPATATQGHAANLPDRPLDSGSADTVWHRLYIEADIPPGCGIRVYLAATGEADTSLVIASEDWHEHRFGAIFERGAQGAAAQRADDWVPRGAWSPMSSELPFAAPMLACPQAPGRAGLFTVLIQRAYRPVKALRGRFLHVRVELIGDGRATPELAAVRAYASRFSYRDRYLPGLYRETRFGPDTDRLLPGDQAGSATPADFLDRFLANFEGMLTAWEDRIAGAYLLTDPATAPEDALTWLGSWVGVGFEAGLSAVQQRRLLREAPLLYRARGTLAGLRRALDIATDGAVARGEIVVLEDYRLRRTFATILGADLADEDDPLLGGLAVSGNSLVGDTLFLGDENRKEFLAVFGLKATRSLKEEEAVATLFDDLAHRITVLVHQAFTPKDLALVRRVVDQEAPAHVAARVQTASGRFLVGLASLVDVDTFLGVKPESGPVRVGRSQIGLRDLVQRPASLDPRLEGGRDAPAGERPLAIARGPEIVEAGAAFTLDASASRPAVGRKIVLYVWNWVG